MTVSALAAAAALGVHRGVVHAHTLDAELKQAEARLRAVVEQGTLERARRSSGCSPARAPSRSRCSRAEERRIAEERRTVIAEREQSAAIELSDALGDVQRRVEQRLADWSEDLERAQANLFEQLQRLTGKQRRLIEEAETRLAGDAERLESESEVQRAALLKLRQELERSTTQAIGRASAELEAHAVERRQALNELAERLHRRERELREELDREQSEAHPGHPVHVHGRRAPARRAPRTRRRPDDGSTRGRRRDAVHGRDQAVARGVGEASLARARARGRGVHERGRQPHLRADREPRADAAQRLDRRLVDADSAIATRRDEVVAAVEQRLAAAERELRQRLDELAADADAQRAIIDARVFELQRRIDSALAQVQTLDA